MSVLSVSIKQGPLPVIEGTYTADPGATLFLMQISPGDASREAEVHAALRSMPTAFALSSAMADGKVTGEEVVEILAGQVRLSEQAKRVLSVLLPGLKAALADKRLTVAEAVGLIGGVVAAML